MISFPVAERWQSGRMRRSRKPLNLYGFREFESPPLRQFSKFDPSGSEPSSFLLFTEFEAIAGCGILPCAQ